MCSKNGNIYKVLPRFFFKLLARVLIYVNLWSVNPMASGLRRYKSNSARKSDHFVRRGPNRDSDGF